MLRKSRAPGMRTLPDATQCNVKAKARHRGGRPSRHARATKRTQIAQLCSALSPEGDVPSAFIGVYRRLSAALSNPRPGLQRADEGIHEAVDIVGRVIERRRRHAQDIGFAPVADHARGRQAFPYGAHGPGTRMESCAPRRRGSRGVRMEKPRSGMPVQCRFQIAGQFHALWRAPTPCRLRRTDPGRPATPPAPARRIAHLPTLRAGRRAKIGAHAKARLRPMAPPAGKPRQISSCACRSWTKQPAMMPGPPLRYL